MVSVCTVAKAHGRPEYQHTFRGPTGVTEKGSADTVQFSSILGSRCKCGPHSQFAGKVVDTIIVQQSYIPIVLPRQVQSMDAVVDVLVAAQHQVPAVPRGQRTVEVAQVEFIGKVIDVPRYAKRQVSTIEITRQTVEVLRVRFINKMVDDPAVIQRQFSKFSITEARDGQDCPRGPHWDSRSTHQADEVPAATPLGEVDGTKKKRKAEDEDADLSNFQRFNDLLLPSSQSCLERKVLSASMASSDEE